MLSTKRKPLISIAQITMAETLRMSSNSKEKRYEELFPQIASVVNGETDKIANMANVASMLWETFAPNAFPQTESFVKGEKLSWMWVGFYRVVGQELVLGPFQGPMACTRIAYGKGVCGTAWMADSTQVVADVDQFPGHIACSSASRSEIVVPVHDENNQVCAVLDIDSFFTNTFDKVDKHWLEKIAAML